MSSAMFPLNQKSCVLTSVGSCVVAGRCILVVLYSTVDVGLLTVIGENQRRGRTDRRTGTRNT